MKTCRKCGKEKPLDQFYNHPSSTDGKQSRCKLCTKEGATQWRKDNPERFKEISRACYVRQHPEAHARYRSLEARIAELEAQIAKLIGA